MKSKMVAIAEAVSVGQINQINSQKEIIRKIPTQQRKKI